MTIGEARKHAIGATVDIQGVVTAESGRLGTDGLLMLQDGTSGVVVRLAAGQTAPSRGTRLAVRGVLAAPYGQMEVRPASGQWQSLGSDVVPDPIAVIGSLDESLEGRLVLIEGVVAATPTTSGTGDLSLEVLGVSGLRIRVLADSSSGLGASQLRRSRRYRLTGVVGQRATASGRLDGYRLWLRDAEDVVAVDEPSPSPSATPGASPTPRPSTSPAPSPTAPPTIRITVAITTGGHVIVEGVVTAGSGLLDSGGVTIVIQDASGAIAVRLPAAFGHVKAGRRLRVEGESGTSYGAPRILAARVTDLGAATVPAPLTLLGQPSPAMEWRLVRVAGTVRTLHRDGAQWRAEIGPTEAAARRVDGLSGAKIPADRLTVGGGATIVGIVRRPYPTARDRRFSILPRSVADISTTAARSVAKPGATAGTRRTTAPGPTRSGNSASGAGTAADVTGQSPAGPGAAATGAAGILDVDLVDLPTVVGLRVRVGGIVTAVTSDTFGLDDGTAEVTVRTEGDAGSVLSELAGGLAVNLVGLVVGGTQPTLSLTSADDLVTVGAVGVQPAPASPDASASDVGGLLAGTAMSPATPEDSSLVGDTTPGGATGLVIVLLLSLAGVGLVALALGRRRPPVRMMAHPEAPPEPR